MGPLNLRDYLSILWARRGTIVAIVVITTAVALIYSFRQTPVYTSSAEVLVLPASFDPRVSSAASVTINIVKEIQVATSAPVQQQAFLRLAEEAITPGTISVSEVEDAETLAFTSVSTDRRAAQATAQAYADSYLALRRSDLIDELNGARERYQSQIAAIDAELEEVADALETAEGETQSRLEALYSLLVSERLSDLTKLNELDTPDNIRAGRILQSAGLPLSPSAPNHARNGLLALFVGLVLGIGVAFFRDRLDERVRGREELEFHAAAPVLGFIPRVYSKNKEVPFTLSEPKSEAAEAFRSLGVRLLHAINQRARTVVITSSSAGEGKTLVAANLGVTIALTGRRAVIVSADLRRPRLQSYFRGSDFGVTGGAGLTEVLQGTRKPMEALSRSETKNLWIVHAGGRAETLGRWDLLGSRSMIDLLAQLREFADVVLIDTPPLLETSDVLALAPLSDGVVLVVDPRHADRSNVEQARHELDLMGVPVIGVVVNKHDPRRFRAYGSGYRDYGNGYVRSTGEASPATLRAIPDDGEYQTTITPSDRDAGNQISP